MDPSIRNTSRTPRTLLSRARLYILPLLCVGAVTLHAQGSVAEEASPAKTQSVFYSSGLIQRARDNAEKHDWARAIRDAAVERAAPWKAMSEDELWDLMFGPNIPRTWHVWSDGYCPACTEAVRMYAWEIDVWNHPWKVRCPHCGELFPKNDFDAFHRSGYDEHGVFQPDRADRSLLFNTDHPDPNDPLHLFGVDDGEGYVADGHRWRFIGWYVIFGHWKRLIVDGVVNLSAAYVVTGDTEYAYKAAILLDRVADLYPTFDFHTQGGWVYEITTGTRGKVSTWHDACAEDIQLILAYDRIFNGAKSRDSDLVAFLSRKAVEFKLDNPKQTWTDIQRNIEDRAFRDTLAHRFRVESNYPRTDMLFLLIHTVLGWPDNREEVMRQLDAILERSTAVDGLSGEKGLGGYSSIAPSAVAEILSQMMLLEPDFLARVYAQRPRIHDACRFTIDTWCMEEWYPRVGDTGAFGRKFGEYVGLNYVESTGAEPSVYSYLWSLYEITKDPALVQVMYLQNGSNVDGLPHDIFADDPASLQAAVQQVIDAEGPLPKLDSVNKPEWRLAVLRSGEGEHRRALWMDYDSGGGHGHWDGMNIGLFAKGLDLVPDFGYPPVGYGGWGASWATWYSRTAAHATVTVDKSNQHAAGGTTTLWADGKRFHAMRASCPEMVRGERYERTIALVDMDATDFYVIDCLRVKGGSDHAYGFSSFFGTVQTSGLNLVNSAPYLKLEQLRAFRSDEAPQSPWGVTWTLDDRYDYLPDDKQIHLAFTNLTHNARAILCDAWVDTAIYGEDSQWIPRLIVQRFSDNAPLESTFVAVIEPFERASKIESVSRLSLKGPDGAELPDSYVAVQVDKADGKKDLALFNDPAGEAELILDSPVIRYRGDAALLTLGPEGPERAALCHPEQMTVGDLDLVFANRPEFVEWFVDGQQVRLESGAVDSVVSCTRNGTALSVSR
ncbi:MAG: hypothetical protein AMXMBFR4_03850 [Candidatus Hydrogenedentota bacterium]